MEPIIPRLLVAIRGFFTERGIPPQQITMSPLAWNVLRLEVDCLRYISVGEHEDKFEGIPIKVIVDQEADFNLSEKMKSPAGAGPFATRDGL